MSLNGVGLHTGTEVILTFKPAPENFGFRFKRNDLEGEPVIEADANYVVNTQRGTNLEKRGVMIQTPEHVLAALVGCDLDNVIIELNESEPPIMDGSSKFFVEAIEKAAKQEKETLEKALATQKEELQKALELVQKFEQEKKEAVTKARFQQVKDAVKDEAKAEVLFKAVNLLEDAAEFEAVVKSLKDMTDLAEKGEMFIEKGVSVEGEGTEVKQESAVAKILKSQNK